VLTRLARASIERGVARRSALHAAHPVFPPGSLRFIFRPPAIRRSAMVISFRRECGVC